MRRQRGVTLLELMITIVIVSILASLAIPAYSKYVQRARRSDAINAIQLAAAAEEKYYFANNHYGDSTALGITASPEGYYTIAITNPTDTQHYLITATPTGAQAADTDCALFKLDNTGTKSTDDSAGVSSPSNSDVHSCWHR